MSVGGGGAPQTQKVEQTTTNLPKYLEPYVTDIASRAQAESNREYTPYEGQRIAGFTPEQQQVQQNVMGLQQPGQFGQATDFATQAGLGSLATGQYNPYTFSTQNVAAPNLQQYQMGTAQTNYNPNLQNYQMGQAQTFGQPQAQQYMSPYAQNVMDVQKREAITDAQKAQLMTNLGAARQGTYGGARQLLAGTERERALGTQLGDIQAKGLQSAYENAQAQFERDRAAQMGVGRTNLEAQLGVQQLGANIGAQTALANLSADQQARVQNLEAQLGVQQLGTQTGLQAALANQQQAMEAQSLSEASRQFGSNLGMQGFAQALQSAQTLGNLGQTQQQMDLQRLQAQDLSAAQMQQMNQKQLDLRYQDFINQRDDPRRALDYYSNLVRGLPNQMGYTQTTSAPPPSMASQIGGLGIGALSLAQLYGGK